MDFAKLLRGLWESSLFSSLFDSTFLSNEREQSQFIQFFLLELAFHTDSSIQRISVAVGFNNLLEFFLQKTKNNARILSQQLNNESNLLLSTERNQKES